MTYRQQTADGWLYYCDEGSYDEDAPDERREDDEKEGQRPRQRRERLCEALAGHPVAVLVGGPGSGKTTTLRWLASRVAGRGEHRAEQQKECPQLEPTPLLWKENQHHDGEKR